MSHLRVGHGDRLGDADRGDDPQPAHHGHAYYQPRSDFAAVGVATQRPAGNRVGTNRTFAAAPDAARVVNGDLTV
jgi:hypothetical protein